MKTLFAGRPAAVWWMAAAVFTAGCAGTPPDRYYTLAGPAGAAPAAQPAGPPLFIEVAPVAVPERLARPQMVVRKRAQGAEVSLLEQSRWSSSFENELRDALSAGIAARLGAVDASKSARPSDGPPGWRIVARLTRFDAVEDDRVEMAVNWTLRRSDAGPPATCQWEGSEAVGSGIDALAQGGQRLVARLAARIAGQIAAAPANAGAAGSAPACPQAAP